jgi:hypothetical protein
VYVSISALGKSEIILVTLLGKSFGIVSIQLDTLLNPRDPFVEKDHQF